MIPAVVVGSGLGALGAMRLLRRAGLPVYSLNEKPSFESRSRWFRPLPGAGETLSGGAPLAHALQACSLERAVLVPCSDALVAAVSALTPELATRFPSSTAASGVVGQLASKARFATLLDAIGVPHPRTVVIDEAKDLERFAHADLRGLFFKPVDSASFARSYSVKGCRVRDMADARAQLARIQADGHRIVVQEYVPGPGSNHFLIDGFAGRNGEVRALFARRRLRMYPPDFGDSTYMISVPVSEVEPAVQSLRAILSEIRYRGIFSAEFKVDERDGIFKILEINARVWIYVEFAGRCGVDVCTMAYRDALDLPLGDLPTYRSGARLLSPYSDLAAARYAWSEEQMELGTWLRSWVGAQQPAFNWTDPGPALRDWCDTFGRLLRFARRRISRPS